MLRWALRFTLISKGSLTWSVNSHRNTKSAMILPDDSLKPAGFPELIPRLSGCPKCCGAEMGGIRAGLQRKA